MTFTVDFVIRFPSLNLALPMNDLRHQECIGRSRGDLMTKIHVTCDALSNSTSFHLSPDPITWRILTCCWRLFWIRSRLSSTQSLRCKGNTPGSLGAAPSGRSDSPKFHPKELWEFDRDKYRWRYLIENFFAKLKQYNIGGLPAVTISDSVIFWVASTGHPRSFG